MLLNHYTAFLEKHMQGKLGSLINEKGDVCKFTSYSNQFASALLPMLLHQFVTIVVGSDNTPETGESYKLKNEIGSGLNVALTRNVVDNDDGSHSSIVVANITNISSSPITIGEIAMKANIQYSSLSTFYFDRTPLGTPLVIQPGEVGRIVYTITMS